MTVELVEMFESPLESKFEVETAEVLNEGILGHPLVKAVVFEFHDYSLEEKVFLYSRIGMGGSTVSLSTSISVVSAAMKSTLVKMAGLNGYIPVLLNPFILFSGTAAFR